MQRILCLFTAEFPFGKTESFLHNELDVIGANYDKILVFPLFYEGEPRALPANAEVVKLSYEGFRFRKAILSKDVLLLKQLSREGNSSNGKPYFSENKKAFSQDLLKAAFLGRKVEEAIAQFRPAEFSFYSFWMNDWALMLTLLKQQKRIKTFFFRVNGFDIYDERRNGNYMPFRFLNFEAASKVFAVCQSAANYLKGKNIFPEKITHSYFGTSDFGCKPFQKQEGKFIVFSCSNMIPLKRIHLIAAILENLPFEVDWYHHGEGPELEKIRERTARLPENIRYHQRPKVKDYSEVMAFFRDTPINLFVNVSETEGLPVTIIEAISFGIPVLATDVGGTSEIVNDETGILIPAEFDPKAVAKQVQEFAGSDRNTSAFHQQVRKHWEEKFEKGVNYQQFYTEIKELVTVMN